MDGGGAVCSLRASGNLPHIRTVGQLVVGQPKLYVLTLVPPPYYRQKLAAGLAVYK